MSRSLVCVCCHKHKQLIIIIYFLILFASTSIFTHHYTFMAQGRAISSLIEGTKKKGMKVQGVVISAKAQIGSRPPKCERRCTSCGHCEAVQVPIVPQFQSHRSHSAARKPSSSGTPSVTYSSRSDDLSNYKPMSWKCKCGNYFFNP